MSVSNVTHDKKAIIIGAGPAGLTAAYELLKKTDVKPVIYEQDNQVGGLSKTVNYNGNRIDIGGHRFFSKSKLVNDFWLNFMPISGSSNNPEKTDKVILIRNRLSRIFFLRKFFNYPVSLSFSTLYNLGLIRIIKIFFSYLKIVIFPIKNEKSLQDFFTNRFGKELYETFFKDYTEKVWGVPCSQISASWGAQRVKGLSVSKTILHALKSIFKKNKSIDQKDTETSLIEKFMYPKYGPGQLWEILAEEIIKLGGEIKLNCKCEGINFKGNIITQVAIKDLITGQIYQDSAQYFFSTMPVKDLILSFNPSIHSPSVNTRDDIFKNIQEIASGLVYRDFITVGLLLKKLKIKNQTKIKTLNNLIPDTWIYIQERDVKIGRLQIFNNWSPYMVKDLNNVWIGLEYFCNKGDVLWSMPDREFINFAVNELVKIGFIDKEDLLDSTVIRVEKTYPAYFGSYDKFDLIKNYLDNFKNLFLIGRNGMHRYNNMDHSMLTAIVAVDNIVNNIETKDNIWQINTQDEYHEDSK